ncbi:MAG: F420-nonreducing hydrogenase [Desulfurobacteriaceae bacterium]
MSKLKFAYYLAGGCAGCDTSLLDTGEKLLEFLDNVEITFFAPTIADFKYEDPEKLPPKSIDFGFVTGNIRNEEHEKIAKVMREKCKVLIAFGICASCGGVKGLSALFKDEEILQKVYGKEWKSLLSGEVPKLKRARALDDVVEVDYYVGGCPPSREHIEKIFKTIIDGSLPPKGSWLTMGKAVCDVCPRNPILKGKKKKQITQVKRFLDVPKEDECLLEQGYLCLGAVTQGDCGARCTKANVPCRGCGGPIPGVRDFGTKAISAIATSFEDISFLKKIPSSVHLFYRYSLVKSLPMILKEKLGERK